MSQIGDECYSTDRINAVCEQLVGFILNVPFCHVLMFCHVLLA